MFGKKEYKKKNNAFTQLSDKATENADKSEHPFAVQRRLRGYTTGVVVFIVFGLLSWVFTKSIYSVGLGLLLALAIGLLGHLQKKNISRDGYDVWHMEVLEETFFTRLNRRPTGIYVEALDGPYEGKVCHLALTSQGLVPPVGRIIEVTLPGNIQANLIRDVYYIPQYYGIELARDE